MCRVLASSAAAAIATHRSSSDALTSAAAVSGSAAAVRPHGPHALGGLPLPNPGSIIAAACCSCGGGGGGGVQPGAVIGRRPSRVPARPPRGGLDRAACALPVTLTLRHDARSRAPARPGERSRARAEVLSCQSPRSHARKRIPFVQFETARSSLARHPRPRGGSRQARLRGPRLAGAADGHPQVPMPPFACTTRKSGAGGDGAPRSASAGHMRGPRGPPIKCTATPTRARDGRWTGFLRSSGAARPDAAFRHHQTVTRLMHTPLDEQKQPAAPPAAAPAGSARSGSGGATRTAAPRRAHVEEGGAGGGGGPSASSAFGLPPKPRVLATP